MDLTSNTPMASLAPLLQGEDGSPSFLSALLEWAPPLVTLTVASIALFATRKLLDRMQHSNGEHHLRDQLIMLALTFIALLAVIVALPIRDSSRSDLLSLLGVVLSAAFALSSTTFLSNAMGALMLRAVGNFKLGDMLQIGEHFGRVTERGLFHTEIQTEERDLLTLPNMYVITNPVRVMRSTGTIVSCTVSLGYDVSRTRIEPLLIEAAEATGLTDPFVHVIELGDFSVTYRINGLLGEIKQLITTRSKLRKAVMDSLHQGGVEIVSPSFMNTRAFDPSGTFIPSQVHLPAVENPDAKAAEDLIFDKADEAETLENSRKRLVDLDEKIKELKGRADGGGEGADAAKEHQERLERRRAALDEEIKERETQLGQADH